MLSFVDCNCTVGPNDALEQLRIFEPQHIKKALTSCNVKSAFAFHNSGLTIHPTTGNKAILEVCRKDDFFKPVISAMPSDTGEFCTQEELKAIINENSIKAVRLFPKYNVHGFSLSKWCSKELITMLEKTGTTVLIDADCTDWEEINNLCEDFPKLNVIITNLYYRHSRYVFALLKRHSNLYLETSGLKSFGLLQTFVEVVGANKMVFGSNSGVLSCGSAICIVCYALISNTQKEQIAAKNLENIFGSALL